MEFQSALRTIPSVLTEPLSSSPPLSRSTEKLEGEKLNVAEVTQSEIAQKQKLQTVLERINDSLKLSTRSIRWNVDCEGHLRSFFHLLSLRTFPVFPYFVLATQSEHPVWLNSSPPLFSCVYSLWRDGRHLCIAQDLHKTTRTELLLGRLGRECALFIHSCSLFKTVQLVQCESASVEPLKDAASLSFHHWLDTNSHHLLPSAFNTLHFHLSKWRNLARSVHRFSASHFKMALGSQRP